MTKQKATAFSVVATVLLCPRSGEAASPTLALLSTGTAFIGIGLVTFIDGSNYPKYMRDRRVISAYKLQTASQ